MENLKKLLKKYSTLIKYVFSAGISFVIDLVLFTIFNALFKNIVPTKAVIAATICARIISSVINYSINRNRVFASSKDGSSFDTKSFSKYVTLVIIQMFVSSFTVQGLYNITHLNETLIKIPVECILFVVNYIIQKLFIFKKDDSKTSKKKKSKNEEPLFAVNLEKIKTVAYIIMAITTSFALLANINNKGAIFERRDTDSLIYAILTIAVFLFYKKFLLQNKKRVSFIVLSIIFTLLLIFGYSFDFVDSARLVYRTPVHILISITKFGGLFPLIFTSLNVAYDYLLNLKIKPFKKGKFTKIFEEHPFKTTFILLLICYIPYIIAFYPAVISPDPANQIREVMGIHTRYMDSVVLLDPNMTITNFNPVMHTLLLGNCFKLGYNIGSVNLGLFLYSMIQLTVFTSALAYSIKFLKKEGVPNKLLYIAITIYAFVPIFPLYTMQTNKDVFFTVAILLYIIKLYELMKHDFKWKEFGVLLAVSIYVFLSRNNGIYTIMLSLPFFLILKEKRQYVLLALVCILATYSCYSKVLLPHFKITETSIRESLSIPFQQTAALINKNEDIIEEKDLEVISRLLNIDVIKNEYNPELADPVKNTFNPYYEDEDLKEYFNIWFKYLLKRPGTYVTATINNMYGYFYPNTVRWYIYYNYNTELKEEGFDFHYNGLSPVRSLLSGYGNAFQYTPLIGLFVNIGFNVWTYMFLVASLIVNKNKKMILILTPALSLILVCVASPANAYFRYAMPYIMTLPTVLGILYQNRKSSKIKI